MFFLIVYFFVDANYKLRGCKDCMKMMKKCGTSDVCRRSHVKFVTILI